MKFLRKLGDRWHFIIPAILIAAGIILNGYAAMQLMTSQPINLLPTPSPTVIDTPKLTVSPTVSIPIVPTLPAQKPLQIAVGEPKLGHLPYAEGESDKMIVIASYAQREYQRFERLAPEAAIALMKLIYAARDDGIWIIPVSGFRSIAAQQELFKAQIERRGSPEAAAKLSAPPGYSEHHTGYALDLGDGHFPKEDITYNFANTDAFRWLNQRAREFGFEMSFPENNAQGVSYEPWHWRYIGTPDAVKIFARAQH